MASASDTVLTLNNGIKMPALGLGVFQSGPEDTVNAVKTALSVGYRMIDTAAAYMNEAEVGKGILESGLSRDEVFVQTKLWLSDYGYDQTLHAFDRSMKKLKLETLDLYLLHWPAPNEFDKTLASWKAAAELYEQGRVRAIGVCNFSVTDLKNLMDAQGIMPVVNQVELHPFLAQPELQKTSDELGIITQAWSPIGGIIRYWGQPDSETDPLQNATLVSIAEKHQKTPAQIILRWHLQLGRSIIPKSVNSERIRENANLFNFELSPEEMTAISALNRNVRSGPDPEQVGTTTFDIKIED